MYTDYSEITFDKQRKLMYVMHGADYGFYTFKIVDETAVKDVEFFTLGDGPVMDLGQCCFSYFLEQY